MAATAIIVGGELLIALLRAYSAAARQSGMAPDQAKAYFLANIDRFMADTAEPVEPPKE